MIRYFNKQSDGLVDQIGDTLVSSHGVSLVSSHHRTVSADAYVNVCRIARDPLGKLGSFAPHVVELEQGRHSGGAAPEPHLDAHSSTQL